MSPCFLKADFLIVYVKKPGHGEEEDEGTTTETVHPQIQLNWIKSLDLTVTSLQNNRGDGGIC